MRLHGGGIDQDFGGRSAGCRKRVEQVRPHALGCPALKAVVERLARPVDSRGVFPAAARQQDMDDAADDPPIIDARLAACVGRQMRLEPGKLAIAEPEMVSVRRRSPSGDLESRRYPRGNLLYGSQP